MKREKDRKDEKIEIFAMRTRDVKEIKAALRDLMHRDHVENPTDRVALDLLLANDDFTKAQIMWFRKLLAREGRKFKESNR